jgi:hypothetical protein
MVQLRFENLVPSSEGEQQKPCFEFTNQAGLSPAEQWFYHWVREMGLSDAYPDLESAKAALAIYLPERTKRYSRNIPNPECSESWLRLVLITGELLRLQPSPYHPALTVAVHASAGEWKGGWEKILAPEFSAARRALGIDKHWMLVLEDIAEAAPSSDKLMNALLKQALDPVECAIVRFKC